MIRLILADDHPVFAKGLRAVFEAEEDCTVAEVAGSGRGAVEAALRDQHLGVFDAQGAVGQRGG